MMIKSKEELGLLPDNSSDIFKKSIIDRYMGRPTCGKFASLKTVCLACFASRYYKKTSDNDYQPNIIEETLKKKMIVTQHFQKKSF